MKRIAAALLALPLLCCVEKDVVEAPPAVTRRTPVAFERAPSIREIAPLSRVANPRRNLFAYEEPVVLAVAAPRIERAVIAAVGAPQPVVVEAPARRPPHFPYRYIGRFGPHHDPIAAFVGNDRVITVRPGEPIDDQFVLRAIGLESVQIEARGWEERIPVGLSAAI